MIIYKWGGKESGAHRISRYTKFFLHAHVYAVAFCAQMIKSIRLNRLCEENHGTSKSAAVFVSH